MMAIKIGMKAVHPGGFIRRSVLPDDLSVTAAAEVLGVGRPALSNLLNGKASLSPEMALRVEKAFGVKMDTLLRMQARYDAYQMRQREKEIIVDKYVPA
jgi:addiction module HigA family antidote